MRRALWGRLERLEAAAEEDTMIVVVEDTGEEVRVPFDAPLDRAVWEWRRAQGEDVEPDPVVARMAGPVRRGAHEKNPDQDGRILVGGGRGA